MSSARSRILLSVPASWDVARLHGALASHPDADLVTLPDAAAVLKDLQAQGADVVIMGWPIPDMDPARFFSALSALPRRPELLTLDAPDAPAPPPDAGIHASLTRLPGVEKPLVRLVESLLEAGRLRSRLEQSERQYTDLLQNTRDAIYILGPTRFTLVNRAFEELLGYSGEEICHPSFDYQRLIAPESRPMILERARLAARGEPLPPRYEFLALNKAGQRLDVSVSVSYIVYSGDPSSLGVLQDITARKQYEKALLRRNRELAVLNDLAATVSRAPDLTTVLEMAVERLIAVMGFNAAGISLKENGRDVVRAHLFRGIKAEQAAAIQEIPLGLGLLGAAAKTGDVQVVRDLSTDPRVAVKEVHKWGFKAAVCVPIQAKDRVLGSAIGLCVDERDFAPEEVSLLLSIGHQLGTAVERAALYDRQEAAMRRLLALDEVARALASTLDRQEVFRVAATQVQHVLNADTVEISLLRTDPEGARQLEVVLQRRRGGAWEEPGTLTGEGEGLRWRALSAGKPVVLEAHDASAESELGALGVRCVAAAPLLLDGKAIGALMVGFASDIGRGEAALEFLGPVSAHLALAIKNARMFSSMEDAYRELKEAKDQLVLQEKLSALGEMSAGVAHDFNNVLGAILGRTQLLKTFLPDPTHLRSLEVIERAALDGAATVRRIQEFSRVGGSGDFQAVDLSQVVNQAVEMTQARWQVRARAEGVEIRVNTALTEVPSVMGNAQELREVLTNLIHNACDAMPQGGAITVATGVEGGRPFVSVQDTGTGMPPEVKARVFDPFFTTKGVKGTGLGLSVSYGIVQRHHGEFEVVTELGQGTTFIIRLPSSAAAETLQPSVPPVVATAASATGARVLVVEDEESIRDILADMLRTAEHHVVTAHDGPSGLQQLDELMAGAGVDVVFTDLGMPGMSGWEVASAVHQRYPGLPVGLITGWGASLDVDKMKSHGVDLVIPKPFRFEQLTSVVAEAMELSRQRGRKPQPP
ncbi:MAG: GAF domain-containing protein [Myxococcota bacterium]